MKKLLLLFFLILSLNTKAQHPGYTGKYSFQNYGRYVISHWDTTGINHFNRAPFLYSTSDGGFIASGVGSDPFEFADQLRIVKFDSNFHYQWTFKLGDKDGSFIYPGSILELEDEQCYLFSINYDNMNPDNQLNYPPIGGVHSGDFALIKVDYNGQQIWSSRPFGSTGSEGAGFIVPSKNKTYILGVQGFFNGDYDLTGLQPGWDVDAVVMRTDTAGNIDWRVDIPSQDGVYIDGLVSDGQGGCYMLLDMQKDTSSSLWAKQYFYDTLPGCYAPDNPYEIISGFYMAHISYSGQVLWCHRYSGNGSQELGELFYDTLRHRLVVNSITYGDSGIYDKNWTHGKNIDSLNAQVFLMCFDTLGQRIWAYPYGTTLHYTENPRLGGLPNNQGYFMMFGDSYGLHDLDTNGLTWDEFINNSGSKKLGWMGIDPDGYVIAQKTFINGLDATTNNGFGLSKVHSSTVASNKLVLGLNTHGHTGEIPWEKEFGDKDELNAFVVLDLWPLGIENAEKPLPEVRVYPNPTDRKIKIELTKDYACIMSLHDLQGSLLESRETHSDEVFFDLSGNPPGSYILNIHFLDLDQHLSKKIIFKP